MDEHASFHPLDYVSVLRRRKWWLITPVLAGIVVGVLLAAFWPKEYLSEAQIGIAAPKLTPELLRNVSSLDREERQRAISQQLVSRQVLERVVREEKLNPSRPVEDVAGWLRTQVIVNVDQPIGRGGDNRNGLDSFRLGYLDADPDRAQSITNRLAYVFVEENSKTQTERAENTSEVLGQQLQASQERLAALELQLRAKKEANMGRLPDQIGANLAMANGLRQSFDSYSMQLRTEQDRLSQLESLIEDMRRGSITAPLPSFTAPSVNATQARIAHLQNQLTQEKALGKTDKHPDIISLHDELTTARAELAAFKQPAAAEREEMLQGDPIYRQRVQERDAARLRIRTLRAQSAQASAQIGTYQSRVEAAPMVEQDLSSVSRDVQLEQARYTDLKTKHENARLAEDLARRQGGERFSVLYPAYPGRPAKPGQPLMLLLMAVAAGVVLGSAMVVGREFLDRSVHDARALQTEFEVPVLGEIPRIHGAA
jgi:polysaccharide chain length determinant protein (PEP-CTERM system associated)